jgi:hypothetical protein
MNDYVYFRLPVGVNPIEVKLLHLQDRWHDARGNDRLTLSFHLLSGICNAKGCVSTDGTKFQLWIPVSDKIESKKAITAIVREEGEDLDEIHEQAFMKEPRVICRQITLNKLAKHNGPAGLWCCQEVKLMFPCHAAFASSADGDEIFFGVRQIEFPDTESWMHFELISKKAIIKTPVRKTYPDNPFGTPIAQDPKEKQEEVLRHQAQQTIFMQPRPCYSVGPKPTSSHPEYVSASASREPFTTINEEEDSDEDSSEDEDEYTYETVDDDNMDIDLEDEDNNSKASTVYGMAETVVSKQKSVATKYSVAT